MDIPTPSDTTISSVFPPSSESPEPTPHTSTSTRQSWTDAGRGPSLFGTSRIHIGTSAVGMCVLWRRPRRGWQRERGRKGTGRRRRERERESQWKRERGRLRTTMTAARTEKEMFVPSLSLSLSLSLTSCLSLSSTGRRGRRRK